MLVTLPPRFLFFALLGGALAAQTLTVPEYTPRSTLVVPQNPKPRAKYPFVDIHSHQNPNASPEAVERLLKEMDSINLQLLVNLSGGSGERFQTGIRNYQTRFPGRFLQFANLDFSSLNQPGFGERSAANLERDVKNGAVGLKIFKNLGMDMKYADGRRVPADTPDLDPVWEMCAKLNIPVLIHTGEPQAFFDPIDKFNERWVELNEIPNRARPSSRYPSFEEVMGEQERLFRKHPKTKFIAAHLAWRGNNLGKLAKMLDEMPNLYTELGAVLAELGRQPFTAREFLIQYKTRVLMGKDTFSASEFPTYFRVFETRDEFFDYYRRRHANWQMYGLDLPDDTLKAIYYKTALSLLPGFKSGAFPK